MEHELKLNGPARRKRVNLNTLSVNVACLVLGGVVGYELACRVGGLGTLANETPVQETEPAPAMTPEQAKQPEFLQVRLARQIRELATDKERVLTELRETRIHYRLLRQQGYPENADACRAVAEEEAALLGHFQAVTAAIAKAEELERRLIEFMHRDQAQRGAVQTDPELIAAVRRSLNRQGLQNGRIPLISWELDNEGTTAPSNH